jgi:hypothetical protein
MATTAIMLGSENGTLINTFASLLEQEHHYERLDEISSLHSMERVDMLDFKEDLINNKNDKKEKNLN